MLDGKPESNQGFVMQDLIRNTTSTQGKVAYCQNTPFQSQFLSLNGAGCHSNTRNMTQMANEARDHEAADGNRSAEETLPRCLDAPSSSAHSS